MIDVLHEVLTKLVSPSTPPWHFSCSRQGFQAVAVTWGCSDVMGCSQGHVSLSLLTATPSWCAGTVLPRTSLLFFSYRILSEAGLYFCEDSLSFIFFSELLLSLNVALLGSEWQQMKMCPSQCSTQIPICLNPSGNHQHRVRGHSVKCSAHTSLSGFQQRDLHLDGAGRWA